MSESVVWALVERKAMCFGLRALGRVGGREVFGLVAGGVRGVGALVVGCCRDGFLTSSVVVARQGVFIRCVCDQALMVIGIYQVEDHA